MASSPAEIKKTVIKIWIVGFLLMCGTAITVAVAYIPSLDIGGRGFDVWDMILGLAIAATKASLVALIFMHLSSEKKMIYFFFFLSIIFAGIMYLLLLWAEKDPHNFPGMLPHGSSVPETQRSQIERDF